MRARPAAEMRRLPLEAIGTTFCPPLAFAHRRFCAAEIRARAAADIVLWPGCRRVALLLEVLLKPDNA
jgi:hypothetical protein